MVAHHIHDALAQIEKLREYILEKRKFRGYSGRARILSGSAALVAAVVLGSPSVPADPVVHLSGWVAVLFIGIVLNYSALCYWFLFDREVRRDPVMIKPALDAIPAFALGGVLTMLFIFMGHYYYLPGMWMAVYGLAQVAYRQSLPRGIYLVGLGYMLCGTICLAALTYPTLAIPFVNPWPMGIVFFIGELIGGLILITYRTKTPNGESE
jgi:hypothetical protein